MIFLLALALAQSPQYRAPSGTLYTSQPDAGRAVERAESAAVRNPANIDTLIALGVAQSGIRRYREAIQTFTRGIRLAPDNPILYRWRGHRYISVREFDRAVADLVNGHVRDTTNYDILYHLGVAHYLRGEFDSAASAFGRAQRRAPNDNELAGSTDWLWMSLARAGRHAEARAALAPLREDMQITSAGAYRKRLFLYQGVLGFDDVIDNTDTNDVAVATLSYGIGNWFLVRGDTTAARLYFDKAVRSGGWPAFGFIASEVELRRLRI